MESPPSTTSTVASFLIAIHPDSFHLYDHQNKVPIVINQTLISFSVDRKYKYKRHKNFQFNQWLDVENELSMNWFNVQPLPLVRKLWGRIDTELDIGNYTLTINNRSLIPILTL